MPRCSKKFDFLEGPTYVTKKSDTFLIDDKNGRTDSFDAPEAAPSAALGPTEEATPPSAVCCSMRAQFSTRYAC